MPATWKRNVLKDTVPKISEKIKIRNLNSEKFIKITGAKITFISSFIFSYEYYLKNNDKERDFAQNTDFPQISYYSPAIYSGKSLFVVDRIVINATGNSVFQYELLNAFGVELPNLIRKIFSHDKKIIDLIISNLILNLLPSFLYSVKFKSIKTLDKKIPWDSLKSSLENYKSYWIFIYPIKFIPRFLALTLVMIGKLINRH